MVRYRLYTAIRYDANHLHTVLLESLASGLAPSRATPASNFASFSPNGRVIFGNFNGVEGCTLYECNFVHLCNRKVSGQSHPSHTHQLGSEGITQGQGTHPRSLDSLRFPFLTLTSGWLNQRVMHMRI